MKWMFALHKKIDYFISERDIRVYTSLQILYILMSQNILYYT